MQNEYCTMSDWNKKELRYSALKVVNFFGCRLSVMGTRGWINYALEKLPPVIDSLWKGPVSLRTNSFDLVYFGPTLRIPKIYGGVEYIEEDEPRFVFFDRSYGNLLPSQRSDLYKALSEISEESARVYKLELRNDTDDTMLVFPRNRYARSSGTYPIVDIGRFG